MTDVEALAEELEFQFGDLLPAEEWKRPAREILHTLAPDWSLVPTEELAGLRGALDEAYADRNLVVQAFAQAMADAGWPVAWGVDRDEPDWPVIYIDTPEGQVSWHIPRSERAYEPPDRTGSHGPAVWDGHSPETKFARLRAALEAKGPRP